MTKILETQIVESLRNGIPPQRGVEKYSVGNEKLIEGIKKYHLSQIAEVGKIRFISGSWGGGKTHFFRIIRDMAFQENCAVSNVELTINSAPLNKFEQVFFSIVRNISTSTYYQEAPSGDVTPIGTVVEESLHKLGGYRRDIGGDLTHEQFSKAIEILMANKGIDIDFKKMVQHYWQTYLPEAAEHTAVEQTRGEILQWFAGEGTIGAYRKRFGVNKMVSRQNAKLMLQSLAEFVKLAGYNGLMILFDEAEQSYSIMRKSALRDAHNNLLSLINNIENIPGIFLIYATTPDFFTDPKHGIVIYGALAGRIGKPEEKTPKALDTVWNLDAVVPKLDDYQEVARRIRGIYIVAYPEAHNKTADEDATNRFVKELNQKHPKLSAVKFWRVMVTALIRKYDSQMEGEKVATEKIYDDVMERLREE
ncbi:MAG: BREX system ATP-binding domain-containing protein [Candidatus Thermoplasmatota archaeon]